MTDVASVAMLSPGSGKTKTARLAHIRRKLFDVHAAQGSAITAVPWRVSRRQRVKVVFTQGSGRHSTRNRMVAAVSGGRVSGRCSSIC